MRQTREVPIGIQDFEKLRREGYLYVDKTEYVYKLAQTSRPNILCRPRRFGKSLLASTLKAYFEGRKELFDGLKIAELETEWQQYPVFFIALNIGIYTDVESVRARLHSRLDDLDAQFATSTSHLSDPGERLKMLICLVSEKAQKQVVVIIDEYDKPLLSTMKGIEIDENVRMVMQGFYGVLKSADPYLRFIFLTGITRFGQTSVFSELNQLTNLTLNADYAGACGITQEELEAYFQPEIEVMSKALNMSVEQVMATLKQRYDGYHFADVSPDVYNPFSLLNAFFMKRFGDYWFETGKPSFLIKVLRSQGVDVKTYQDDIYIRQTALLDYKVGDEDITPLLYQSGYLTIRDFENDIYRVGYPNDEVKYGFIDNLITEYAPVLNTSDFLGGRFAKDLKSDDLDGFMERLTCAIADIPYNIQIPLEAYYHTICYLLFAQMGAYSVRAEVPTARGRSDVQIITDHTVYLFEFKTNKNGGVKAALAQIEAKGYAKPHLSSGKKIVKVGVEFDLDKKELSHWEAV